MARTRRRKLCAERLPRAGSCRNFSACVAGSGESDGGSGEDLYYRINVIRIHLLPLKARGNDVLLIAQHFIERFAKQSNKHVIGLATPAAERHLAYAWPGNVRELMNCMERAVALTEVDHITVDDPPEKIRTYRSSQFVLPTDNPTELQSMDQVEKRYVLRVLQAMSGNKTLAAPILGLQPQDALPQAPRLRHHLNPDCSQTQVITSDEIARSTEASRDGVHHAQRWSALAQVVHRLPTAGRCIRAFFTGSARGLRRWNIACIHRRLYAR